MTNSDNTDSDSPWKDILERYFVQFIEFFFPDTFSKINWDRGHEFLDKELQKIVPSAKTGSRTGMGMSYVAAGWNYSFLS